MENYEQLVFLLLAIKKKKEKGRTHSDPIYTQKLADVQQKSNFMSGKPLLPSKIRTPYTFLLFLSKTKIFFLHIFPEILFKQAAAIPQ